MNNILEKLETVKNIKNQLSSIIHSEQIYGLTSDKKYTFEEFSNVILTLIDYYKNDKSAIIDQAYINNKISVITENDDVCQLLLNNSNIKSIKSESLLSINNFTELTTSNSQLSNVCEIDTPNCEYIGNSAFHKSSRNTDLSSINIPNVTYVGDYAFRYNTRVKKVNFESLSSIGFRAFYQFGNENNDQIEGLSFPNLVHSGKQAFANFKHYELHLPALTGSTDTPFQIVDSIHYLNIPNINGFNGNFITSIFGVNNSNNRLSIDLSERISPILPTISNAQLKQFSVLSANGAQSIYNKGADNKGETSLSYPRYMFILKNKEILENTINNISNNSYLSGWQWLSAHNETLDENWKIFKFKE